jgi:hypothetical protein
MHWRLASLAFVLLTTGLGVGTAALFANGRVVPGVLGAVATAGLLVCGAWAARGRRPRDPSALPAGGPRPASAPPDGHVRFTLVVEGLEPDRIAEVWSDLCRLDRPPPEGLGLLFRTFTVVEGRRFRFRQGDPAAAAALLARLLGAAAGVPVRTSLEPAAERTPPWS